MAQFNALVKCVTHNKNDKTQKEQFILNLMNNEQKYMENILRENNNDYCYIRNAQQIIFNPKNISCNVKDDITDLTMLENHLTKYETNLIKVFPDAIGILANSNNKQKMAVLHAMKYPLTLVQGPPGTGYTSIYVNLCVFFFQNLWLCVVCLCVQCEFYCVCVCV